MRRAPILALAMVITAALFCETAASSSAGTGGAVKAPPWQSCMQVNKSFPHGIGKLGARDKARPGPVKSFSRSTTLYNLAIHFNKGLDRDGDGIACERA